MTMGAIPFLTVLIFTVFRFQARGAYPQNVEDYINLGEVNVKKCIDDEVRLVTDNYTIPPHTAEYKFYLDSQPTTKTLEHFHDAFLTIAASQSYNNKIIELNSTETVSTLATQATGISLDDTDLGQACEADHFPSCNINSKYRTIDGSCNNVKKTRWGRAITPYYRCIPPKYKDDIFSNIHLQRPPFARSISEALSDGTDNSEDSYRTLAIPIWGQFIANDLSQTVVAKPTGKIINCCKKDGGKFHLSKDICFCAPIEIQRDDPVYGPNKITCMNYVRSSIAQNLNCTLGPGEQVNQATHYLDASMIYGSDSEVAHKLRGTKGKLKINKKNYQHYLPDATEIGADECKDNCYASGDLRVNDHPQLTAMYTIWVREHNRLARRLKVLYNNWTDTKLYQEARRIVIAKIQHITYHEWLPNILAHDIVNMINYQEYNANINPETSNEAATAALRFVYSLMQENINLVDEDQRVITFLRLSENFFNPRIIEFSHILNEILRGLATQSSRKLDLNFIPELTSKYYANQNELGLDIFSLDIQRGRDHGLAKYNDYRVLAGLSAASNFDELEWQIVPEVLEKLKNAYESPDQIDLIVGLLAEKPQSKKSIGGITLEDLLIDQFERSRKGDRYFYDNLNQPYPFTSQQLSEIKKSSLAKIICDNSKNIQKIQPNVFRKPGPENEIQPCSEIQDSAPEIQPYFT